MRNKSIWITSIIILLILSMFLVKSLDEDSWICTEVGWVEHGKPSLAKPKAPCGLNEEHKVVEKYLRENISNISPTKEVLGGRFYITKINWLGSNSGTIEYEDGHILLNALFDYKIKLQDQNNDYSIEIKNFNIIK